MSYAEQLQKISKIIGRDAQVLKRVGPAPKGMSRFKYIADILPQIDNFMITDKADGTRGIIELGGGHAKCIVGSDYFEFAMAASASSATIDCEVLVDKKHILVFDILEYDGRPTVDMPFTQRHKLLEQLKLGGGISSKSPWSFTIKKFYQLTTATYQKNIMALYAAMKKYSYETDGIIFTSIGDNYMRTQHHKWKPAEHLTIDFLYTADGLYSGVARRQFKQIGLDFPQNYLHIAAPWINVSAGQLTDDFFPVPFTPSIAPDIYKHPIMAKVATKTAPTSVPITALNQIIEVSYDIVKRQWCFHKIRTDRVQELADGHYYGNNFEIAEITLESILNPLTIGDLVKSQTELSKGFYFEKSDDKYKAVRKYNSFVKGLLIKRYTMSGAVIDMASGKGQDLGRYYNAGMGNLLMLEIDQSAIDEIINRKFEFSKKLWLDGIDRPIRVEGYRRNTTALTIAQMDFNAPTFGNIKKIEELGNPHFGEHTVDVIICNMALHYLVGSAKNIKNVVAFIAHWLRDGGDFIFTSMNAARINELLKVSGKWADKGGIYKIEKARPGHIKVLLPCSRELREEPLVDMSALDKEFKAHSIMRVETKSFDKFFEEYASEKTRAEPLDESAKQFVGLYHYAIFKKIK